MNFDPRAHTVYPLRRGLWVRTAETLVFLAYCYLHNMYWDILKNVLAYSIVW